MNFKNLKFLKHILSNITFQILCISKYSQENSVRKLNSLEKEIMSLSNHLTID